MPACLELPLPLVCSCGTRHLSERSAWRVNLALVIFRGAYRRDYKNEDALAVEKCTCESEVTAFTYSARLCTCLMITLVIC